MKTVPVLIYLQNKRLNTYLNTDLSKYTVVKRQPYGKYKFGTGSSYLNKRDSAPKVKRKLLT